MRFLYGHDKEVAEWVAEHIDGVKEFKDYRAIGVLGSKGLIFGSVYNDYHPEYSTMQISYAATNPMWAKRNIIASLLAYPFIGAGVYKCWVATDLDNEHSLKTTAHIGFKREAVLAHHFGRKKHAVISRMLRPDFERLYGDYYAQAA